jgi:hypothetical protein
MHPPRRPKIDHRELVVIRTYQSVIDAELAKTALDSVGIDSMVRSDNEGGQSPGLSFARGVELLVRADDVEAAKDILGVQGGEAVIPSRCRACPETGARSWAINRMSIVDREKSPHNIADHVSARESLH